jgi:hypothetical protein
LWGHLKAQVYINKPRTIEALKANLSEAIQEVTPDVLARLSKTWRAESNAAWTQMVAISSTCYVTRLRMN